MSPKSLHSFLVVAITLLGPVTAMAQNQPKPPSAASSAEKEKRGAKSQRRASMGSVPEAVKNDRFDLKDGEYKLEHPVNVESSPAKHDNIEVDYQIGTIEGKPATVSVFVDKAKAPKEKEPKEAEKMFGIVPDESVHTSSGEETLQHCPDGKVCAQTDDNGDCIKWVCSQ